MTERERETEREAVEPIQNLFDMDRLEQAEALPGRNVAQTGLYLSKPCQSLTTGTNRGATVLHQGSISLTPLHYGGLHLEKGRNVENHCLIQ